MPTFFDIVRAHRAALDAARAKAGVRPGQDILFRDGERVWHPFMGRGTTTDRHYGGGIYTYAVRWDEPPPGTPRVCGMGGHQLAPADAAPVE
jgi:hypothetical protein